MEGFNWWGVFYFVMPIVLILITWIVFIIAMILDGVSKLIRSLGGKHERIKRKAS